MDLLYDRISLDVQNPAIEWQYRTHPVVPVLLSTDRPVDVRAPIETMKEKARPEKRMRHEYGGSIPIRKESLLPTVEILPRPVSRDGRLSSDPALWRDGRPESLARSILSKSSILLRRKNSKNIYPAMEWAEASEDEEGSKHVQELSKRRRAKHSRSSSAAYEAMLKQSISNPYNFQHLTHTGTHHGKLLRTASENDMVIEFSAIRAAQAPRRELKGIRADSLYSRMNSLRSQPPSPTTSRPRSRLSPTSLGSGTAHDMANRPSTAADPGSLMQSRSIESFQRVSSKSFSSPNPPLSPPARRSSRAAATTPSDHNITSPLSPAKLSFSQTPDISTAIQCANRFSAAFGASLPPLDASTVGNAVSTPDDTAFALGPPTQGSSCTPLAEEPEDEENQQQVRASTSQQKATATSVIRDIKPSLSSSSLYYRNERLAACVKSFASVTRNASDPTLPCSAGLDEEIPNKRLTRRFSEHVSLMDSNWEDDIDYCYEHAAEADCAFEWDRASNCDDHASSSTEVAETNSTPNSSFEYAPSGSDRSSLVANESNVSLHHGSRPPSFLQHLHLRQAAPGIDASSPHSTMTSPMSDLPTPSDSMHSSQFLTIASRNSQSSAMLNLSPSLLVPQDYESRMNDIDSFQEKYCNAYDMKHPQYAIYTPSLHRADSLRSTESPPSNCNSRESMIVTRPSSIDPFHRSNSSVGSLPELVPSRTTREKFEVAAEQLASHLSHMTVALTSSESSLRHTASEGHSLRRLPSSVSMSASISEEPEEVLVPMPAVPSSQAQRDRADSDAANRLLNMASAATPATVGRSRSTTVGGKIRASYSLFPTTTR